MLASRGGGIDWEGTLHLWGSLLFIAVVVAAVVWGHLHGEAEKKRKLAELERQIAAAKQAQWDDLCRRFGPEIAARLVRQELWRGETLEMLIHSFGRPEAVDEEALKTKTKHVLKWGHLGGYRYTMRVTLENDVVVGWER